MPSARDYALLTRVGPGTPMGRLMREYWIPACASAELKADGAPLRLMLLGEKLIAFRDSAGRIGILDHRCPHRCASLFFGRNEENGLRCVYHGWKYDVDGNCLDMPNLPPQQQFKDKVKARAYRAVERNGLVYAYMGERAVPPPLPMIEPLLLPEGEVATMWVQRECNWLQALEGDIDTSHFGFLHEGKAKPEDFAADSIYRYRLLNRAPEYHAADMDWGVMYAAHRPAGPGQLYYRLAQFVLPFWTMIPAASFARQVIARGWVPLDDTHTMFVSVAWSRGSLPIDPRSEGAPIPGASRMFRYLPNTTDWLGRWRLAQNAGNDYEIDRAAQRERSFTGIEGIHVQDQAITESMGPIVDHAWETLAPSDIMIARTRQRLLQALRALERGEALPALDDPERCLGAHSGDFLAPAALDWRQAYAEQIRASANPTGALFVPPLAAE